MVVGTQGYTSILVYTIQVWWWLRRDIPSYWYTLYMQDGGYTGIYYHTGIQFTGRLVATQGYTTILVFIKHVGWWLHRDIPQNCYTQYTQGDAYIGIYHHTGIHFTQPWTFRYLLPTCRTGTFRYLLDFQVPLEPLGTFWILGTSWTFRYLLPTLDLCQTWTFRYLLKFQVPLEPLGTFCILGISWTFRYLFDLQRHVGLLGTSWTFRYNLDLYIPLRPLGTLLTFRYHLRPLDTGILVYWNIGNIMIYWDTHILI